MATIKDVAEKAGISATTVSRVLNNRGYISEATRQLVYDTMAQLNYQPNELARALQRKQSNVIGLIIPDVAHPFFAELAGHIEYYAYESGYKLLLCNSHMNPVKEKDYINMLKRNRVAGIIMCSHTLQVEDYRNLQRPIVTIERQIDASIPYVASDNYSGGRMATELLIARGCSNVAHICGNLQLDMLANARNKAFVDVAASNGIRHITVQTELDAFDRDHYRRLILDLLREQPELDGIFASSDMIAAMALQECMKAGKRVPEQMRIIGYDDVGVAGWLMPPLTTVRQPIRQMSALAVDLLRKQLAGEAADLDNVLAVELIERGTT